MNGPILYAEDDENDAFLMRRALKKLVFQHPLQVVPNGRAAIDYLGGESPYDDRDLFPFPALAIFDLKMPDLTGIEALQWVRAQPSLARLPVVIFSSSTQPADVAAARRAGANAYLIKQSAPLRLHEMLTCIRDQVFGKQLATEWWNIPWNQELPLSRADGGAGPLHQTA